MLLLDTNIFFQHNKDNPMDIHVSLWDFLTKGDTNIEIKSIIPVYVEINDGDEKPDNRDLRLWSKQQKANNYFIDIESAGIQQEYNKVANYVVNFYMDGKSRDNFLDKADAWLIAVALHFKDLDCKIISYEKTANGSTKTVKIPDVAAHFNITCFNFPDFCRQHNKKF